MSIKDNLNTVYKEITDIMAACDRGQETVTLLAVSKTKPIESLQEAYNCGQRLFGENRVNEAEIKVPLLPDDAIFHMIGHLQGNKVNKACRYFDCIQSVDSLKLAKKIDKSSGELKKTMDIYLDINIVNDMNKTGFIIDEHFFSDFREILQLPNLNILGLMCMGAHVLDHDVIKTSFVDLKQLSLKLLNKFPYFKGNKLSMGMSSDFKIAIEAGSTIVRIGSSIFGMRN